jgi:hypothetical protein
MEKWKVPHLGHDNAGYNAHSHTHEMSITPGWAAKKVAEATTQKYTTIMQTHLLTLVAIETTGI